NLGLIVKFTKPGSKKIYLKVERNIFKLSKNNLINQKDKSLTRVKELIPNLIEKYKLIKLDNLKKKKLEIIENYYRQMLLSEKLIDNLIKEFDKLIDYDDINNKKIIFRK
ncbi:MAG: hypothetical protein ACOC3V_04650, partial [bacterium]